MLVEDMVEGFEIDYAWVLISVIYERDFKTSQLTPFLVLSYRFAGKPVCKICHCGTLRRLMRK